MLTLSTFFKEHSEHGSQIISPHFATFRSFAWRSTNELSHYLQNILKLFIRRKVEGHDE